MTIVGQPNQENMETGTTQDSDSSAAPSGLPQGVGVMKQRFLETKSEGGDEKGLSREQDRLPLSIVGTDYSRSVYEKHVFKEHKAHTNTTLVPVNKRVPVAKVAPPEIARNVKSQFEAGDFHDLHLAKKINININDGATGAGVYENQPIELEGVIRNSDFHMEGEELEPGITKNLVTEWKNYKDEFPTGPRDIQVAEDDGKILENDPTQRTDVIRECDVHPSDELVIERGHAANLMSQYLNQEKTVQRKEIKLVEDPAAQSVFESQPQVLEGVVRSGEGQDDHQMAQGATRNLKGYWATRTDEVEIKRGPVQLVDHERSGPTVLESQPEVREGVVRGSDALDDEVNLNLTSGHTKNKASRWERPSEERPKGPTQPITMDLAKESGVIENNPTELEGVIRSDMVVEDVIPGNRGRTKDIANAFLESEPSERGPREQIYIERSEGPIVLENEPAQLAEGVVRGDSTSVQEVPLVAGSTKNLLSHWGDKEKANLSPITSAGSGKPKWISEIESARDAGVYENEPQARDTTVTREEDLADCDQKACIPENFAKGLKGQWIQKAIDEEKIKMNERVPELVCFTPPREVTPPPLHQDDYQSTQTLTLSSGSGVQNGADSYEESSYHINQEESQPAYSTNTSTTTMSLKLK